MSVKERVEDAQILYRAERPQGALLGVLVAVAATSRKRRPRPVKDSEAFIKFVGEEMLVITAGGVLNYRVSFGRKDMKLEEFLYKWLRCELAHEGKLPSDVHFVEEPGSGSLSIKVADTHTALSHTWMDGLLRAVRFAPENTAEFPDVAEIPEDVVKWMLFGKRRASPHVKDYWRAREHFAQAWANRAKVNATPSSINPIERARREHPNAYQRWTSEEDETLRVRYSAGEEMAALSRLLGRQPSAIRSRLRKLELVRN